MGGKGTYKDSLHLPSTDFPMRGNLAQREPEILAAWARRDLAGEISRARDGAPSFIVHDGPSAASGPVHYGHVLNQIREDLAVKYRTMTGSRSPHAPSWDCHDPSIERAVTKQLGTGLPGDEIRARCREHARKWVDVQQKELLRLGVFAAWDRPQLTCDPAYEAACVRALACFARAGHLHRSKRSVYWCPGEGTALDEFDIEYRDRHSPSIYLRFPMAGDFDPAALGQELAGKCLSLAVWTTTPWTVPANLAVVVNPHIEYVAVPAPGQRDHYLVVARCRASEFLRAIGAGDSQRSWVAIAAEGLQRLVGARYRHPLGRADAGDGDFKVWCADYVNTEQGTGLVHTAPGHGADDFATGVACGLEPYSPIDARGRFTEGPWQGMSTDEANPAIVDHLAEIGVLLNRVGDTVEHSYPHCRHCMQPVLFRASEQWFLRLDHRRLRERALSEIDRVEWIPARSRDRIRAMVEGRSDWCLSRQRAWGVPIPALHCDGCGAVACSAAIMEHAAAMFEKHGADAWVGQGSGELLPAGTRCEQCGGTGFRPGTDVIDSGFVTGCSWFATTLQSLELGDIDLYLDGAGQHRGWIAASLVVGIGVAGCPPFSTVITHGRAVDELKRRPGEIVAARGAEVLRMWVASVDTRSDGAINDSAIAGVTDWYRKFRNTCRFMLGNLRDYDPGAHGLNQVELRGLDRYVLARIGDLVARVRAAYEACEFHAVHRAVVEFVTGDLSALYLDAVKDRLYASEAGDPGRRAAQAVLYTAVRVLAILGAPITCFTSEDIWHHLPRRPGDPESVHLARIPEGRAMNWDSELARRWRVLLSYRQRAAAGLEAFRAERHRSLDARVTIVPRAADRTVLQAHAGELAELFIVSEVVIADGELAGEPGERVEPEILVEKHGGQRCERCRKWAHALSASLPDLCDRCARVMTESGAASFASGDGELGSTDGSPGIQFT